MRRFLFAFLAVGLVLFALSLVPGIGRLIGSDLPQAAAMPLPGPVSACVLHGGAPAPAQVPEKGGMPGRREVLTPQGAAHAPQRLPEPVFTCDANGHILRDASYRKAVFHTFALGDAMG